MRLLRHLSFSNVIAMLALFVALGGAAYAGTKIDGSSIKNASIGGGKLKNETITGNKLKKGTLTGAQIANASITGTQIAPGSIDASEINVSSLGAVPLAQAAQTAAKADSATKASTADSATTATNADNAKHAESADSASTADSATKADSATTAGMATHAETADDASHADSADSATHADSATTAGEADTLNGQTAAQLTLSCKAGTEFFGGMCWDEATRPAKLWLGAVVQCAKEEGRLPSIEELIAFVLRPGEQVTGDAWSGDIDSIEAKETSKVEVIFTTDELGHAHTATTASLGYRCVFPQSN
jgi:hypothetical protein